MKYTRRRQLLHALKFHMLDKATDRVMGPNMTGETEEQRHQRLMKEAGHKVPIHAGKRKTRGGGGLRLFTRRHNPPKRYHLSHIGYANGPPPALAGDSRPRLPAKWYTYKTRGGKSRRRSTRRGVRASRKRPTR